MNLILDIQRATLATLPTDQQFTLWVLAAVREVYEAVELTIRIVDVSEMTMLNSTYRHKEGPTNVLSFPFESPPGFVSDVLCLGDIVICAELVIEEAKLQHKKVTDHWAHLVVHGCLHLMGYDHVDATDADVMEGLEKVILKKLGMQNPYEDSI